MSKSVRPLSPHISIYRWQITMVLSILHRITGVCLYAGLTLLILFLGVVAYAPENYAKLHECLASPLGQIVLYGWTFSFYFHFYNGLRHMFWDMGKAMDIPSVHRTGWAVITLSILSSLASWFVAYHNTGVL